jgi:hypothetical protein
MQTLISIKRISQQSKEVSTLYLRACSPTAVGALHSMSSAPSGSPNFLSACSKLKYGESLLASLTITQCTRTALSSQSKALANWWQTGGDNLRRSVSAILKAPYVMKKLDVFMPGRLDSNYMIEHYAEVLIEMVKE